MKIRNVALQAKVKSARHDVTKNSQGWIIFFYLGK